MKKFGLRAAIVAMAVIVVGVGSILMILLNNTTILVSGMMLQQTKAANSAFATALQGYQDEALERAEMIAGSQDIIDAAAKKDNAALLAALKNYSSGLDLITLCDADGVVLARTHNDKTGDSVLSQQAISTAINTGKGISTIEQGTVIGLSTRGSAAIKDKDGKIIGALTCGHDLSQPKYIDKIKAQNSCEATFFAGDTRMSTTLLDENGNRAVGTKASDAVIQAVITNKGDYSGRVKLFGITYEVYYSPVIVNGQVIGMLFTGVNAEGILAQQQQMVILIIVAAILLIMAVVITALIINWTTKKSYWYESILDSIPFPLSITDMNMNWTFINKPVEQMLNVKRTDVIGKHCSNWGAAICKTGNCGITCLQNGKNMTFFEQMGMDFRVDVSYLNDASGKKAGHIEIVQDISEMMKSQRAQAELAQKIDEMSEAFISGSKQIAGGSQALAQGSTQQASVVEELSASIGEISEKTGQNADMARKAASLSDVIKTNAEKGNSQMDQMVQAVMEINEASNSIGKVIKVIDDIAFQTNILALNAAVEAARAGQHGKGFAVVADEVRNLAAKSAVAANDTSGLIENSIQKANLGLEIARGTADSLKEIVGGINESAEIVMRISQSSDEQAKAIAQINMGIEQVAQVVHQNSATAQQSAAASEEMSGQADMLGELVSKFRVQDNSKDGKMALK